MFLPEDFKLLMIFFRFHASSSLPNFRQNMLALYKKAFNRFKDSFYVIQRSIRNEEARGENADADKLTPLKENENQYKDFIVTFFHQQLIRGLFNQVDFGKRAMCLELLLHLKTCLSEELYKAQWYPDYMYMLFAAFNDTYESNLVMLKNLLLGLPPEIVFRKVCAAIDSYYSCLFIEIFLFMVILRIWNQFLSNHSPKLASMSNPT